MSSKRLLSDPADSRFIGHPGLNWRQIVHAEHRPSASGRRDGSTDPASATAYQLASSRSQD